MLPVQFRDLIIHFLENASFTAGSPPPFPSQPEGTAAHLLSSSGFWFSRKLKRHVLFLLFIYHLFLVMQMNGCLKVEEHHGGGFTCRTSYP